MKKLLLAVSILGFAVSCKTKHETVKEPQTDTVWQAPMPATDNPQYDSLKHLLDEKRRNKKH